MVPLLEGNHGCGYPIIAPNENVEQSGVADTILGGEQAYSDLSHQATALVVVWGASTDGSPPQYSTPVRPPENVNYDQQVQGGVTANVHDISNIRPRSRFKNG